MKVSLISRIFLPHIGGIETLTYDIARGLLELGINVKVLTSRFSKVLPKEEAIDGVKVRRYNLVPGLNQFLFFSFEYMLDPDMDLDIAHFISCYPSFFNWYGIPFFRDKGIPIVYTTIWPIPLTYNLYRRPYIKKALGWFYDNVLLKRLLSKVNVVVTLTRGEAEVYRKLLENSVPIYVVPEAVDPPHTLPSSLLDEVREAYGILDDELVIGLIGRVVKYKRADLALKVLKLISKKMRAKLVIIGPVYDEEYFKYVRQMVIAYKLEDKVVFTGRVSFEMRDAFYSIIDILIHTSEYEAFVRPALEGWRYKKPIVSFNLTPASDFIEEEGGGVTTKRWGDYVEMAKLIEELVKRNMIEDLGENGYKALVRKYLKDKVALSYFHIYEELLDV